MTNDTERRLRALARARQERRAPQALLEAAFPIPPEASSQAPAVALGLAAASVAVAPFLPVQRTEPLSEGAALVLNDLAQAMLEEGEE